MPEENEPSLPSSALSLQPVVAADVDTLAEFSAFVAGELDQNLRPATDVIAVDHVNGAAWASKVPGQGVFQARMRYFSAQQTSLTTLDQYIEASEILIETIRRIMAVYSSADGQSLDLAAVAKVFGEASAEHKTDAELETERENRRLTGR
jgi:hypothetical protein